MAYLTDAVVTVPTPTRILDVFTRHFIYDILFASLSPACLVCVGRVSRITRDAVHDFGSRAFNINKRLSRFFSDPVAFRTLQVQTACVISGSFALQFFDRTFYPKSDLNLYVEHGTSIRDIAEFLLGDGYLFAPNSYQTEDFQEAWKKWHFARGFGEDYDGPLDLMHLTFYRDLPILEVLTFVQTVEGTRIPEEVVQIVLTKENPVACVVEHHLSMSCVMNIITYNSAVSFYSYATFEDRVALSHTDLTKRQGPALRKYMERGWKILADPTLLVTSSQSNYGHRHFYPDATRWMDDDKSWFIHLDTTDVEDLPLLSPTSTPLRQDPALQCSWCLGDDQEVLQQTVLYRYVMVHSRASSSILTYTYTVRDGAFLNMLCDLFRHQGTLEHIKLPGISLTERQRHGPWTWYVIVHRGLVPLMSFGYDLGGTLICSRYARDTLRHCKTQTGCSYDLHKCMFRLIWLCYLQSMPED
ncbi:hypothetical protein CERSUDRAFT_162454 [Gelatoporia subvermispora B]|uniref:Uncharacterized protein n=1 Tax=Ceriporiopsis subvermispora (strain B) TaxID=914234 RepID=M2QZK5_CERS8|nr:hypothetical protein CERSUDRAFT_162454 [Gelatoporia subvermispora B]